MQKILATLIVAAFVAAAVPAGATTADKNTTFFVEMIGEHYDADAMVTFTDGTQMTMAEAVAIAVERAGNVDLAAVTAGLAPGDASGAGDVWVLEFGTGGCGVDAMATPVPFTAFHNQAWTYAGGAGTMVTEDGSYTYILDWTTKTTLGGYVFGSDGYTFAGQSDFWCFEYFGFHSAFIFGDGVVTTN